LFKASAKDRAVIGIAPGMSAALARGDPAVRGMSRLDTIFAQLRHTGLRPLRSARLAATTRGLRLNTHQP